MTTEEKLRHIRSNDNSEIVIAILGLGSVGNYLLSYLLDSNIENIQIVVAGRNSDSIEKDINIQKIASSIRGRDNVQVTMANIDLSNIDSIDKFFKSYSPDIVVNSSRAHAGIKYGRYSWEQLRAYGIWTPLSSLLIRNIMASHANVSSHAIVINTSYSDASNAWLKSGGLSYPDFGSGNLNHLVPRIKFAVRDLLSLNSKDVIEVCLATSHFHNVVISKEGHVESVSPLLSITVNGEFLNNIDYDLLYKKCVVNTPSDQRRNMMNASSNFEIIDKIITAVRTCTTVRFHSPGFNGMIGGYPVEIKGDNLVVRIDERFFTQEQMVSHNKESMALDGVEMIEGGVLTYTTDLVRKIKQVYKVDLQNKIHLSDMDKIADLFITRIFKVLK